MKCHLVVDVEGTPFGVTLSPANRHDSMMLAVTLDVILRVRYGRSRPHWRPRCLRTNKAYDHRRCRRECRQRTIVPHITPRDIETSNRLGRHHRVVECTFMPSATISAV